MKREDLRFNLHYSFYVESMHARFFSRIDKLMTFSQIAIGSSVFASVNSPMLLGGFLVFVSAASFVWQPAVKAASYALAADRYAKLIYQENQLSDDELNKILESNVQNSHDEMDSLCNVAFKRTAIKLNLQDNKVLSWSEKIMASLAGDLPR